MNKDYPELQQFPLAGYFNQDWVDDHKSANEVIDFFISESSEDTIATVLLELEKLVSAKKRSKTFKSSYLISAVITITLMNGMMGKRG